MGWSGDSTYSFRSSTIFKQVALDLNYEAKLVDLISRCFDYEYDLSRDDAISAHEEDVARGFIYQRLFKLSHNSDLVRCNTSYSAVQDMLKETFSQLFIALDVAEQWIKKGLLFAARLCQSTGSPVQSLALLPHVPGASVFGSNRIRVESANDVKSTYERLELIRRQELCLDDEEVEHEVIMGVRNLRSL
ncbi:SidE phosphodiesterase domain-containing protein [Legionella saoudiensis]|uniref:SidE phosphodiesterase domain-containing protein n=1 Tax=Legionella saoudiensis TaxID=1750561 RepID=UPI0007318B28|nr:SidE phosphodiesterase domain-containing protein [Legionella saoudiensis]